jgi:hypothetical protein
MRWRVLAWFSLGVNIALAAAFVFFTRQWAANRSSQTSSAVSASSGQSKANIILRRQFFSWRDIESDDYPTYVANLRDIGCPEQTIRDIIIADVNGLYTKRRALEILTPEQQWWRPEPDSNVVQVATEKTRVLDDDAGLCSAASGGQLGSRGSGEPPSAIAAWHYARWPRARLVASGHKTGARRD